MVVTLAELKGYLGLDVTDTSRDTQLTKILNQAQVDVENALGYPLETNTVTAEQRDYAAVVVPMHQPVSTLTVKYRVNLADAAQDVTLTEWVDYMVYTNNQGISRVTFDLARLVPGSAWLNAKRLILGYSAGWAIGSVPEPLKYAVTILAAYKLRLNDPVQPTLDGTAVGDPMLKALPRAVQDSIAPYKKLKLP